MLLVACQQSAPKTEAGTPPGPVPKPGLVEKPLPRLAQPIQASKTEEILEYLPLRRAADTLLCIQGRQVRVQLRARLDTAEQLALKPVEGSAAGYQGYFTFVMRDSLNRVLSKRTLTKQTFYKTVGPELAVASAASLPQLLGYSEPFQALVFTIYFGAPGTDWTGEAVLLLDLRGRVRRLASGFSAGGPSLAVTLAADGRSLLTYDGIIRANQPVLPLQRPGMQLVGAFLLNDSLAVTIYEPGGVRPDPPSTSPSFQAAPREKWPPNTFVINTHTGKTIGLFRYDGFFEELGYVVPYDYLPATCTAYLLDDKKGLYLVSARQPSQGRYLPFDSLGRYKAPRRSTEVKINLMTLAGQYDFFVDTLAPARIRYRRF